MRRLILGRLIWIYAVCKSLLLAPMAVNELIIFFWYNWRYKYLKDYFSIALNVMKQNLAEQL